jgi:chorismate-pyruvate lyase
MKLLNLFAFLRKSDAAQRQRRSMVGLLTGRNRRREGAPMMVQGELALKNVRPIGNNLREDDVALVERRDKRVIWETPVAQARSDDQDHAWNRLRERRAKVLARE